MRPLTGCVAALQGHLLIDIKDEEGNVVASNLRIEIHI